MRPEPTEGKMSKLLARLLSLWQLLHLHIAGSRLMDLTTGANAALLLTPYDSLMCCAVSAHQQP